MAKPTTQYKCSECGYTQIKWAGQCPSCKAWATLEETAIIDTVSATATTGKGIRASQVATGRKAQPASQITANNENIHRLDTHISEVNRVLGGGLVAGGVVLLAGEPGIGKSTSAASIGLSIAGAGHKVLYISGEETEGQIASRVKRINPDGNEKAMDNLHILAEGNLQNAIQELIDIQPAFFIVDSIQTLLSDGSESRIGSITQVNEVASAFTLIAKKMNIPAILIGQVTKDNAIAGPRVIEHLVDVVLFFETNDDSPLRFLRGIKNRYASTDEVAIFVHTSEGLMPVEDPSSFFTSPHAPGTSGFAKSITMEGRRALPTEFTALVTKTKLPNPRKITSGIEHGRALQMQAVLDRYIHLNLDSQDVYVATTGGLKVKDASTDLAALAAIVSSALDVAIPDDYIFIGEVSLTGEIRTARERVKRCVEADRLGYTTIYTTPLKDGEKLNVSAKVVQVSNVQEVCQSLNALKNR